MNERISISPDVQHGKPVIKGTRVPVVRVLDSLAGGMSIEEVVQDYAITEEDVRAAIAYAAELLETEQHYPIPTQRT